MEAVATVAVEVVAFTAAVEVASTAVEEAVGFTAVAEDSAQAEAFTVGVQAEERIEVVQLLGHTAAVQAAIVAVPTVRLTSVVGPLPA